MRARNARLSSAEVVQRWRRELGIDVAPYFVGVEHLQLREEPGSGLEFFHPPVIGDAALYEALQRFPWYYLENKWEFERALAGMPQPCRLLEVGCGRGAFLRQAKTRGHTGVGLETNPAAAAQARAAGLDVRLESLPEFLASNRMRFDRVFSFQLLEHLSDPLATLREMATALAPGGRICFAVPNADGFLATTDSLLDMPPHHLSRWRPRAIERIAALLGARRVTIEEGPLEEVHFDWFLETRLGAMRGKRYLLNGPVRRLLKALLRAHFARRIKGHSVYAEYHF